MCLSCPEPSLGEDRLHAMQGSEERSALNVGKLEMTSRAVLEEYHELQLKVRSLEHNMAHGLQHVSHEAEVLCD